MTLQEALRILADVHTRTWISSPKRWSINLGRIETVTPEYVEAWRVVRENVYGRSDY